MSYIKKRFLDKLFFRILGMLILLLLIPVYLMLDFVQDSYQRYIENELSERTISTIAKGEEDIRMAFQNMAAATNVFSLDDGLVEVLKDGNASYYDKMLVFDEVVSKISTTNLFSALDMHFMLVDAQGQGYADSAMAKVNFEDESIQNLIYQDGEKDGHLRWELFSPIIQDNQQEKYICVTRSLLDERVYGEYLGTLIVCINQNEIGNILSKYQIGEMDFVYVCMEKDGEILFYLDEHNHASHEMVQKKAASLQEKNGHEIQNIKNQKYIMSYYQLYQPWGFSGEGMYVLCFTEYTSIVKTLEDFADHITMILLVFLLMLVVLVIVLSHSLTRPVTQLERCVKLYSEEQMVTGVNLKRKDEIGSLSRTFYEMEIKINDLFVQLKNEAEVRERYRYQALRAQVNPHFLFNTLNMIRWMAIIQKADNITEMLDALGTILKYSMEREGELIPLKDELEMIHKYIYIQNYRYGRDCLLTIDIPEELMEYKVIKFILQPVVENSFIHAFKNFEGQPQIVISSYCEDQMVFLCVKDNGSGIKKEFAQTWNRHRQNNQKKITGIGLANVDERIRTEYGDSYGIEIGNGEEGGSVVKYRLPYV